MTRCDNCGHFIAYKDLGSSKATVRQLTPDSVYSVEEYEWLCPKCVAKEQVGKNE